MVLSSTRRVAGFGGPGEPKAVKAAVGYIHFAILTEAGQVCGPSSVVQNPNPSPASPRP